MHRLTFLFVEMSHMSELIANTMLAFSLAVPIVVLATVGWLVLRQ